MPDTFPLYKQPAEKIPPSVDFDYELAQIHDDEEIASVVVTAIDMADDSDASAILDGDAVIGNGDGTNSKVLQLVIGGADGEKYKITIKATTNNSNGFDNAPVLEADIILRIEDS